MNNSASDEQFKTIRAYLKSLGLDPSNIQASGWDGTGYFEFLKNAEGQRYFDPHTDRPAVAWKAWPDNFDFYFFLRIAREPK